MAAMDERTRLLPYEDNGPAPSWDGPNDPRNPKNWPASRKWTCAMLVSAYSIIAPTASSMVVPAMPALTRDLHIESPLITQLSLSIYVLGWGMGPLIMGPLSELYGRAPLLHLGQFGFLVFNTLCGLATDARVFLALRFVGGVFGSGPMSVRPTQPTNLKPNTYHLKSILTTTSSAPASSATSGSATNEAPPSPSTR